MIKYYKTGGITAPVFFEGDCVVSIDAINQTPRKMTLPEIRAKLKQNGWGEFVDSIWVGAATIIRAHLNVTDGDDTNIDRHIKNALTALFCAKKGVRYLTANEFAKLKKENKDSIIAAVIKDYHANPDKYYNG